ncbi:DUF6443 domain-containing protein [Mucilaginibacter rubeus]|uniref:RHS repeat-associated core domain-containing protein n=1 Tax=Mucilaginibacter rubeus TaxID=2027860 RepID=A0A5C1HTH7_9SPHI|nr:DUF6443 domain-containing protein [Mucilaginibacter rubeus]QEM09136.1 RHS repeat-associated core domain-containing protein [Mucilaginibacter rubeus]
MKRNAYHNGRFKVPFIFLLLLTLNIRISAQTYLTPPVTLTTAPAPGSYYNNTGITLTPNFSFAATAGNSLKFYIVAADCVPQTISLSANQNYILTSIPRTKGLTSNTMLAGRMTCELMQTVQYIDGLGRPLQTIQIKGSPLKKDIVQAFAYDQYGREAMKYLPYAATTTDGSYKSDALTGALTTFYNPGNTGASQQANGIPNTSFPFAQTGFESSPLNRVIEQGAPGSAWQLGTTPDAGSSSHSVRMVYTANDQSSTFSTAITGNNGSRIAALYTAGINSNQSRSLSRAGNNATYSPNQLSVTITRNENWQPANGCFNTTEEYKDKEGHVVLKRTYNIKGTAAEELSTYYVYDDLGNLSFVLPPGANPDAQAAISQATLDNRCYQYRYDARNRLVQKKVPGKGWEYIIYNKLDQPVATQDSVQRMKSPQEWMITKYDAIGRTVLSGIYQHTGGTAGTDYHATLQAAADTTSKQWETPVNSGNGYTANTWPKSWSTTLSVNYYDTYAGIPSFPGAYDQTANPAFSKQTTGLLTASKTLVLNTTGDYLWSVPYYDNEGQVVKSFTQHYVGGGSSLSMYNYDADSTVYNFVKQPTLVQRKHYLKNTNGTAGVLTLTERNSYAYDHMGRKQRTVHQLQDGSNAAQDSVILTRSDYNEVAQLKAKGLHSKNGGTNYLQTIDYRYNPRGWLSSINNANLNSDGGLTNNDSNDKFGEELSYDGATTAAKQYGGNIATAVWKSAPIIIGGTTITPVKQTYDYGYDNLNRLRSAVSTSSTAKDNLYGENVTYDNMGNITNLGRYDRIGTTKTQIDTLTYTYNHYQVNQVDDASTYSGAFGFQDPVKVANEYTYDGNGNELKDQNKGISSITYNLLNLPQLITKTDGSTVTYVYSAAGNKLRKILVAGGLTTTTEYENGIEYDNSTNTIAFIQTEEGRARKSGSNYVYEYDLKDHLGNTRVTLTPDPNDATQQTAKLLQENDFYAFGYGIQSTQQTISPKNEYLYNHKELQEETGLYDYGARFYDPVIGRWTSVDPLAEKGRRWSPYVYGFDNSLIFVDPDGMWPDWGRIARNTNDILAGAINALASDMTGANAPMSRHSSATVYNFGRRLGHVAAIFTGGAEFQAGGTAGAAGVVAAPESGGLSLGLTAAGGAVAAHGTFTIKNAIVNIVTGNGEDKGEVTGSNDAPTERYNRKQHYGNTPKKSDRNALNAQSGDVVDHDPPLVERYYEGDPSTGEKPGYLMTPEERKQSANDRTRMKLQPQSESNSQGGKAAKYSNEQKKKYGL